MRHLVIAGTGRSGTSFLVEWLAASGLDVGEFDPDEYHPAARAGWERSLMADDLPFVVKDPWLFTYCHDVDPDVIEALVLPLRRLSDAAASRVRVERDAGATRDVWGWTNGGALLSLDITDQARLLAAGFYELLQWAVAADVPTVLLHYPRLVDDADYCIARFEQWLPDADRARAAHQWVAA